MIMNKIHEKDLLSLLRNKESIALFSKEYFPSIEIMDNGAVYVLTNKFVYDVAGSYNQKFLHFNKKGELLTDVTYNYTLLDKDGYLMRIDIPLSATEINFQIVYFVKIDDLKHQLDVTREKSSNSESDNISESLTLISEEYNTIIKDPVLSDMSNSREFFTKYINHNIL